MTQGILLVNKAKGSTSFSLVHRLRKITQIEKIGHAGTLDPFATGLMVLLIGKGATSQSDRWLTCDKEYKATLHLGISTDSYDIDGAVTHTSQRIPTLAELEETILRFQGGYSQVPPMFSAKKIGGKKLYDLARKGITVERAPVAVTLTITLLSYTYPQVELHITCSKGTYIRSLAHDIGLSLGTGAHLFALIRLRSGPFHLDQSIPESDLIPGVKIDDRHFYRNL